MQAMNFRKSVLVFLMGSALLMSACAKKDESTLRVSDRGNADSVLTPDNGSAGHSCSDPAMAIGRIYNQQATKLQFISAVKGFVSATLNPDEIGEISNMPNSTGTGVELTGSFVFGADGNLDAAATKVTVKIIDSYVGVSSNGHVIQPYVVDFSRAKEGYYDANSNTLSVTFEDSYGSILFEGQYTADKKMVNGRVSYANKTAVSNGTPASGMLGYFSAYTCALIK